MRISFGRHVLDTERRELHRGGEVVHLAPKALALLEVLIVESPKPVAKHVLLDRVWPGVVVEEQNVKNTVVQIRTALGDDASFIRTVQRFGYAFSGDVPEQTAARKHWLYCGTRPVPIAGAEIYVGRDPECTICLDSLGVSRRHARVVLSGGSVTIEDLGSKNGTWVEERRIVEPTTLSDGDRIRIGAAILVFRVDPGSASTLTEQSQ